MNGNENLKCTALLRAKFKVLYLIIAHQLIRCTVRLFYDGLRAFYTLLCQTFTPSELNVYLLPVVKHDQQFQQYKLSGMIPHPHMYTIFTKVLQTKFVYKSIVLKLRHKTFIFL